MTDGDLSARLFVRLYTSLLDDEDMVEVSYAAIGVYTIALLLSKHTAADGRVPISLLRRDAALRPGTPLDEALEELAEAGPAALLEGRVEVRSWAKYNELSAEILAKQAARKESARRANHERWHDGPIEQCTRCNRDVSPAQSESDPTPNPPGNGSDAHSQSKSHSQSHSQSHSDDDRTDSETDPDATDPGVVAVADRLIEILGYLDEPSTTGERRYVARAHRRGWTTEQLIDVAHEAASRTDVDDVRQWLVGCLRKRANTDPPQTGTPPPPAERRPLLDDNRTPCERCDATGIVDHESGEGVTFCPDCHPMGAHP